jgi:erythromycin esterase-like protein
MPDSDRTASDAIRGLARPLNDPHTYDSLFESIGSARYVLIGEASHGTHEFYAERARITQRLIVDHGFAGVAVEADWPDAYRVNRFVRGRSNDRNAEEALSSFKRFPAWMWRNTDVQEFVEWLRGHNNERPELARTGFYGLDLYSLFSSIEAVIQYLSRIDPEAAGRARERYSCFDHFSEDSQAYGYAATRGLADSCETEVIEQLLDLRKSAGEYVSRDGYVAQDEYFYAEQNARLARNAEAYYRSMFHGRASSWNLRDQHMVDTLDALASHLERRGHPVRLVVWAHNSHLGDARATEMSQRGECNVGQLVRERHPGEAFLVGGTTHTGTVTAATEWDGPAELKHVRPSLPSSLERILHDTGIPQFLLHLRENRSRLAALEAPRLERAIGVIYRPETERYSHYFHTRVLDQFDALLHWDRTTAVEPLEHSIAWKPSEPAETYPTGL